MIKDDFTIDPITGKNNGKISVRCDVNTESSIKRTSFIVQGGY